MKITQLRKLAANYGIKFTEETTAEELEELIAKAQADDDDNSDDADMEDNDTDDGGTGDDDKKKKSKDPEYLESELKKAIDKRDKLAKERRKLAKEKAELEELLEGVPKTDEVKALRKELNELRAFREEIKKKQEEAELAKLDDVKKVELRSEREIESLKAQFEAERAEKEEALQKEREEKEKLFSHVETLRRSKLEGDIIKYASKHDAFNPEQVGRMLMSDFEYDTDLGAYVHLERDAKGNIKKEKYVEEYVEEFLKSEDNANLIRSKVNTSPLHANKTTDKDQKHKSSDLGGYNPNDPEIKDKADFEGMTPERYIKVVLMRKDQATKK